MFAEFIFTSARKRPDVEPFAEAFRSMWEHLVTIHRETGHTLEHINLGGGIPVNYLRDRSQADQIPEHERDMLGADLEPSVVLAEALRVARESARAAEAEHLLDQTTILLEPGRSVIADAGLVLTTVLNMKRRPETGDVWLLTDAGYNIMLSMNNYKWYYHMISATRAGEPHESSYKVAGHFAIRAMFISISNAADVCLTIGNCRRMCNRAKCWLC